MLDAQLNYRRSAWEMQADGSYIQRIQGEGDDQRSCHELLIALAEQRQKAAARLKKKKVLSFTFRRSS